MTKRRRTPFEEWSAGANGEILFCVQDLRLATRRARAGLADRGVHVYKVEGWAELHAARFGHDMAEVYEAVDIVRAADGRAA